MLPEVPQHECLVEGGRHQLSAIRVEVQCCHQVPMALEMALESWIITALSSHS